MREIHHTARDFPHKKAVLWSFDILMVVILNTRWWLGVVVLSTMWSCPLIISSTTTGGIWIFPFFSNLELCVARWARFMCHHELWPTSVSHLFSFLNSSSGLAGGKHYQKITILIWKLVLKIMTSSNGNIFRVTGHLCRKFTDHRWIPRTKASDAKLLYFLWLQHMVLFQPRVS